MDEVYMYSSWYATSAELDLNEFVVAVLYTEVYALCISMVLGS